MPDLPTLISRLRTAIDDVAGDKSVFGENLARSIKGNQVTPGGPTYQLNNTRIVAGTLQVNVDAGGYKVIGGGGYAGSEDDQRGRFTLTTPAASSLFALYDFTFFTDTELTSFLNQAVDFIDGLTDPTQVVAGLIDALVMKAGSDASFALSHRRASLYNAGAGGKTAQKGDISKKYKDLAKDLFDRAVAERAAFYGERKGSASSPAFGKLATKQKPYTPIR